MAEVSPDDGNPCSSLLPDIQTGKMETCIHMMIKCVDKKYVASKETTQNDFVFFITNFTPPSYFFPKDWVRRGHYLDFTVFCQLSHTTSCTFPSFTTMVLVGLSRHLVTSIILLAIESL